MSAKRDFGSFHSSNVQELLSIEDEAYEPPPLPIPVPYVDVSSLSFGSEIKKKHFLLEEDCVFLNHGAFGAVLRHALENAQQWQSYIERQPLRFYDRQLLPHLVAVTRRLAGFVDCDPKDLILMPNVTTAINCIMRAQDLKPGDVVLHLSVEYGAVKKIIKHVCEERGALIREVLLKFPIQNQNQILDLVSENIQTGIKLAVFDHIPSNTPYILPVAEIVDICHSKNVPVLIDGAHALGQLDLKINNMNGVDYYLSNAHKWLSSPKGCAFMYVNKKHQATTKPLVISHGVDSGFTSQFIWAGLRDYSPWLAMHAVLDFWEQVGPENIRRYIHDTARQAGELLVESWKSRLLVSKELTGSMLCVQLPKELYGHIPEIDYSKAEIVQNALYYQFNIEVPVKAVQGDLYVRISAHIYNHLDEYKQLAEAVLKLKDENIFQLNVETS